MPLSVSVQGTSVGVGVKVLVGLIVGAKVRVGLGVGEEVGVPVGRAGKQAPSRH